MGTLSNVPSDRSLRCIPRKHVRNCATPTRRGDIGAVSPHPPKTRKPVEVSISVDRFGGAGRATPASSTFDYTVRGYDLVPGRRIVA